MATVAELTRQRASLERDLGFIEQELARLVAGQGTPRAIADARAAVADTRAELTRNQLSLAQATAAEKPVDSAGAQVQNDQTAQANTANTQRPEQPPAVQNASGRVTPALATTTPTNVERTLTSSEDSGTNATKRTITNTQSTPPNTAQPSVGDARDSATGLVQGGGIKPGATPGVGAGGDDKANIIRNRLTQIYSGKNLQITPQPNALAKYSSYTYNISIYIMSPTDYRRIIKNKKVSIPGSNLLIQSGGMPYTSANPTPTNAGVPTSDAQINTGAAKTASAGRNQFFPLDFYIDNVRMTGLQPGKGTNSSHNITQLSFKIIEPNGISLLDNLYQACAQYVGPKQNYASQNYLMIIRFFGYDEKGNLVKAFNGDTLTDSRAVIEKYIPFQFTGIKFKVSNNLTEYNCECVCPQNNVSSGQMRGVIPYNIEIQASTLKELFNGPGGNGSTQTTAARGAAPLPPDGREITSSEVDDFGGSTVPTPPAAPPKGDAAPKPLVTNGLVTALNKFQQEQKGKSQSEADVYDIVFLDPIIASASTKPPDDFNLKVTGSVAPATANQQVNPATNSVQTNTQTKPATAGTSIIQFIDQAVRNSSYIYKQQTKIPKTNPQTGKLEDIPNGTPAQVVGWYRIGLQAEPLKYDEKRKDYAYKITYSIAPYLVNDIKSNYFPQTKFRGTHKKYNYWFTGENVEVLSFEQDFNYLYYIVMNSNTPPKGVNDLDHREEAKRAFQTRSNESDQGQEGKTNEPAANAADLLYSPADLARARISIIGDPAWIAQGETWAGISGQNLTAGPFFPDGTINTEIEEPLFEIAWNKPVDYSLATGLMNPNQRKAGANAVETLGPGPSQSYVYRAVSVTSNFNQGRFTQDLEGVIVLFPSTAIKKNEEVGLGSDIEITVPKDNDTEVLTVPPAGAAVNRAGGITQTNAGGAATSVTRRLRTTPPPGAKPGDPGTGLKSRPVQTPTTAPTGQGVNDTTPGRLRNSPPTSGGQPVNDQRTLTAQDPNTATTRRANQNGAIEK
jgi:hypothetical protein